MYLPAPPLGEATTIVGIAISNYLVIFLIRYLKKTTVAESVATALSAAMGQLDTHLNDYEGLGLER